MNEDSFLSSLFQRLPAASQDLLVGPGDDCAAIATASNTALLLAVDQVISGHHYLDEEGHPETATPASLIGRKLLARNLSDIAAMGGTPTFCLVALAVSRRHQLETGWLDQVLDGILQLASEFNVQLIGGDLAASSGGDTGSLTVAGTIPADRICRRGGAAAGDLLYCTGCFGDSFASGHHLQFIPRCAEGQWLSARRLAKAMIDVSDGLLLDGLRVAQASGLSLGLELANLPLRNPQRELGQAITDGEDYELLFAVDKAREAELIDSWPFGQTRLSRIGSFNSTLPSTITDDRGNSPFPTASLGYDHWQTPGRR